MVGKDLDNICLCTDGSVHNVGNMVFDTSTFYERDLLYDTSVDKYGHNSVFLHTFSYNRLVEHHGRPWPFLQFSVGRLDD
ncbi:hypothetical protein DPMN_143668 [Dreissena polymorpha]|uniref:Uncharacterized protein n=1 Tax=Dreissena polymorpha TaxID=45954 RepID=A0A9D4GJK5_DREPO|nr:hypothetical protein DPMN_143668 [Dreissena polymorpha]